MKRPSRSLLLILTLYLLITVAYSIVNPLFEAPDEHWHYFTAQYFADTGELPYVAAGAAYDEWLSQEAAQPPLYYLLGAGLINAVGTENPRDLVWLNPFFPQGIGNAAALANRNAVVHTSVESWPWQGFVLAAHLLRGMSTLLGLGTLLCIYSSGRLLWPDNPQLAFLGTAVIAFLPQYNFVHSAISNDPLIIFLSSLVLWQLLRLWDTAVTRRRLLLLGITIGLAALTKNAGILLLLYTLGMLFLKVALERNRMIKDRKLKIHLNLQSLIINLSLIIFPVLFIAGWLWWRNLTLYSDWTATNQFIQIAGGDREYTLWQVLGESNGLWLSLIAVFGWFNVRAPEWIFWVWNGMVILALVAGAWGLKDLRLKAEAGHPDKLSMLFHPSLWLAVWPLVVYVGLVAFMLKTEAAQGRLLFPAILPLALGLAYGLSRLKIGKWQWLWPGLAFITTVYSLIFVIQPAYAKPATITELPAHVEQITKDMGHGITLLGAEVETTTAVPGDEIWFTLYWQVNGRLTEPPELVVELFGRDELTTVAKLHSYHGRGLYPANLWPQAAIIADRFAVHLDEKMAAPVLTRTFVHLAGEESNVEVGFVKVAPVEWPQPSGNVLAQVGNGLALTAVSLSQTNAHPGDTIAVDVQWQVTAVPAADYTTLIHLSQSNQPPLATGDSPPLNGRYPTRIWAVGELIDDQYTLMIPDELPDGRYPIWIGMYAPKTGDRLPVFINNQQQPHDVYLAGWIDIRQ